MCVRCWSSQVGEQRGAVALIVESLQNAHKLVDAAERTRDQATHEAETKAEELRRGYKTAII
jgi:hypothetical protein